MVDLSSISAAIGSLKAVTDMAKGVNALKVSTEVREKTSDLLDAVLDARASLMEAQDTQSALLVEIDQLKQEIAKFENWDAEKQRYELKSVGSGAYAYSIKPGMENGEEPHWLCQQCFEDRHKSLLQATDEATTQGRYGLRVRWNCGRCPSSIWVGYNRDPSNPDPS